MDDLIHDLQLSRLARAQGIPGLLGGSQGLEDGTGLAATALAPTADVSRQLLQRYIQADAVRQRQHQQLQFHSARNIAHNNLGMLNQSYLSQPNGGVSPPLNNGGHVTEDLLGLICQQRLDIHQQRQRNTLLGNNSNENAILENILTAGSPLGNGGLLTPTVEQLRRSQENEIILQNLAMGASPRILETLGLSSLPPASQLRNTVAQQQNLGSTAVQALQDVAAERSKTGQIAEHIKESFLPARQQIYNGDDTKGESQTALYSTPKSVGDPQEQSLKRRAVGEQPKATKRARTDDKNRSLVAASALPPPTRLPGALSFSMPEGERPMHPANEGAMLQTVQEILQRSRNAPKHTAAAADAVSLHRQSMRNPATARQSQNGAVNVANPTSPPPAASLPLSHNDQHTDNAKRRDRFPVQLYDMIESVTKQGRDEIISFTLSGKAFEIHQPELFEAEILPKYFSHGRLASFKRQLHLYGFSLIGEGEDAGAYHHPMFRGVMDRETCELIRRPSTRKAAPPST